MFGDCLVDIEGEDIVGKFKALHPKLNRPFELKMVSDESVVKYIVAMYDISSPFVRQYFDLRERRNHVAKYADFPKKGGHYIEEVEDIVAGKNSIANDLIVRYMFCQADIDFIQLQTYQHMYYDQVKATVGNAFEKPGDFEKLKKNIDSLTSDIKRLQRSVFEGNEIKNLRNWLYNFVENISTDFRPEDRAERLQNGEEVVDHNPYGDYQPNELKFLGDE